MIMERYHKFLLIFVVLIAAMAPVSAVMLNGSTVITTNAYALDALGSGDTSTYTVDTFTGSIFGGAGGFGSGGAGGRDTNTFDYGRVIAYQIITFNKENSPLAFTYTFADGSRVSGTIRLAATSTTTGTRTIYIDNTGMSYQDTYVRIPVVNTVFTTPVTAVAILDAGSNMQYFALVPWGVPSSGWTGKWDDSVVANVPLSKSVLSNPIQKSSLSTNGATFSAATFLTTISDYADSYTAATQTFVSDTDDWYGLKKIIHSFDWLFNPIAAFLTTFGNMSGFIASFSGAVFGILEFAGKVFVGFSAFYTAIAMVLSIANSSDLFVAWGKFYRYEMKLFRFYMELIRAVKTMFFPFS